MAATNHDIKAATAKLAETGAALVQARERLQQMRTEGGPLARFDELEAERAILVAETNDAKARAEHSTARERDIEQRRGAYVRDDATLVAELAPVLARAAAVEERRVRLREQFEAQTGRQVSASGDVGNWPELFNAPHDDISRLERWLQWARERRGCTV